MLLLSVLIAKAADTPDFYVGKYGFTITSASNQEVELTICTSIATDELIPEFITYNGKDYTISSIGVYAFYNSNGTDLQRVVIPKTVKKIGVGAFSMCNKLTEVFLLPITPPIVHTGNADYMFLPKADIFVPNKSIYEKHNKGRDKFVEILNFDNCNYIYSGTNIPLSKFSYNGSNYEAYINQEILLEKNVGTYETILPATLKLDDKEWSFDIAYSYQIQKKELNIFIENSYKEYGEPLPQFNVKYEGFVVDENQNSLGIKAEVITSASMSSDAGEYALTLNISDTQNYYYNIYQGTLFITKAPLRGRINELIVTYGTTKYDFSITYEGLKLDQSNPEWVSHPSYETSANNYSPIGKYEVIASGYEAKNYSISKIDNGILSIIPATLRIVINSCDRLYFEDNPRFTYQCHGFQNNETASVFSDPPVLSCEASILSNCGKYPISCSEITAKNYSIDITEGELMVRPRMLNLILDNYSRPFGEENPEFSIKYSGFVNNENISTLTELPYVYTTTNKDSNVGEYLIKTEGGDAKNYVFNHTQATLSIVKAYQEIEWNQDLSKLSIGNQIELQAIASSGLEVRYSIIEGSCAELYTIGDKTILDCQKSGEGLIRAQQLGNMNYYASTRITNCFHISNVAGVDAFEDDRPIAIDIINGAIRINSLPINVKPYIFNLNGELVYTGDDDIIRLQSGVYIIKIGNKSIKVII